MVIDIHILIADTNERNEEFVQSCGNIKKRIVKCMHATFYRKTLWKLILNF